MPAVEFEYEYETESGIIQNLVVTMDFDRCLEKNYGADADGNRGVDMWFLEPSDIEIHTMYGMDVTDFIKNFNPSLYKLLEEKAFEKAEASDD